MKTLVEVTYKCAYTGETVVTNTVGDNHLPEGWVLPEFAIPVQEEVPPPPPRYTVIAFSSKKALDNFISKNLNTTL